MAGTQKYYQTVNNKNIYKTDAVRRFNQKTIFIGKEELSSELFLFLTEVKISSHTHDDKPKEAPELAVKQSLSVRSLY